MPTDVIDRLPPQNTEAEEAVIGSCLMDSEALGRVRGDLEPGHFYRGKNASIYAAMLALAARREPVDFVTVESELKARGQYDEVGGLPYLSETLGVVPTAVHVEHYAGIVKLAALRRGLISAAGKIAAMAYDEALDFDGVLTASVEKLAGVQVGAGGMDLYTPEQQATILWDLSQRLAEGKPAGIPSSFYKLTWLTGGYRRGCLYVIGASTGVGKTSWMGTEARALAKAGRRVLFASSEMSVEELVKRNASAYIGRDWNAIERELSQASTYPETPSEVGKAVERMVDEAFHVYHQGSMSVDRIRRRAAKMQAEGGLDLLFVDYLQRLQPVERRGQNREQQVTEIARSLKSLAADLGIPVVVAAQFSRAWLARDDEHKEPMLSDFRESGGIEQEADVALALFRRSKFDDRADPVESWLYVLKNRHGQEDTKLRMNWRAETTSYDNYTEERR